MKTIGFLVLSGFILFGLGFLIQRSFDKHTIQPGRQFVINANNIISNDRREVEPETMPPDHDKSEFDFAVESESDVVKQDPGSRSRVPGVPLFDFSGREPSWYTVNDNVMGGLSQSQVAVDTELRRLSFSGDVSLENNGGFASTRSQWTNYNLGAFDGIALRVRGDGNIYRLRIRTEETGYGIAYTSLFDTRADTWQEVYIPFSEMVPLYRGYVVNAAGPLNPVSIRSFGLMMADKQEGTFSLEVDWINAVAESKAEIRYANNAAIYI
jgi:NADH dehydrogenase [ubiquinone] 1 alpha subcomplex assembly factor 1